MSFDTAMELAKTIGERDEWKERAQQSESRCAMFERMTTEIRQIFEVRHALIEAGRAEILGAQDVIDAVATVQEKYRSALWKIGEAEQRAERAEAERDEIQSHAVEATKTHKRELSFAQDTIAKLVAERDAARAGEARCREALAKIAAETPGDTGVDMGRPGGDCHTCEDMIAEAREALGLAGEKTNG